MTASWSGCRCALVISTPLAAGPLASDISVIHSCMLVLIAVVIQTSGSCVHVLLMLQCLYSVTVRTGRKTQRDAGMP